MPKKPHSSPGTDDTVLVSVAKAMGTAAGKIVSLVSTMPEVIRAEPARKSGRLRAKTTSRVPRKQKKANQRRLAMKE